MSPAADRLKGTRTTCRLGKRSADATAKETRRPVLQAAGVHELSAVTRISYSLSACKDDPIFCQLAITAAQCPVGEVLFAGGRTHYDVPSPMPAGMRACLVRPVAQVAGLDAQGARLAARHRVLSRCSTTPARMARDGLAARSGTTRSGRAGGPPAVRVITGKGHDGHR